MGDVLQHDSLAALGAGHQQAALALADRCNDVNDAPGKVFLGLDVPLHLELFGGEERGEVFEKDLVLGILGRLGVDLVDFDQRKVAFTVLWRSDLALDRVAGMQIEAAYLRRADIDVVRPGEVGGIRRSEEPESIRQHFQSAFAENAFAFLGLVLQQREDQILFAQAVCVLEFVGNGHLHEFGDVEVFEIGQMHEEGALLGQYNVTLGKKVKREGTCPPPAESDFLHTHFDQHGGKPSGFRYCCQ